MEEGCQENDSWHPGVRQSCLHGFGTAGDLSPGSRQTSTTGAGADSSGCDHVARAGAIAVIRTVGVRGTVRVGDGVSTLLAAGESGESERLIQRTNGVGNVEQFFVDSNNHAAESDDHAQDADRQNENQFGGNDQTAFVIPKFLKHV